MKSHRFFFRGALFAALHLLLGACHDGGPRSPASPSNAMPGAVATAAPSVAHDSPSAPAVPQSAERTAYLTTGHGEINESRGDPGGKSAEGARKLIAMEKCAVKELGAAEGLATKVPEDATFVAVLGPTRPFSPSEIGALERYADKGGKLLLALDPDPGVDLRALAAVVDVAWKSAVLAVDKDFVPRRRDLSDRVNLVTNAFSSHAAVSTLARIRRAPVVFAGAAALEATMGTTAEVDFAIWTRADTWADTNANFQLDADAGEVRARANLAAAVTKRHASSEMRAVVLGDADVFSDALLGVPPALVHEPNVVLLIDIVRWLGGQKSFAEGAAR